MSLSICANSHPAVVHEEAWCPVCELRTETDKLIQDLRAELKDAQRELANATELPPEGSEL